MRVSIGVASLVVVSLGAAPAAAQDSPDWFTRAEASYANAELEPALREYHSAWHEGIEQTAQLARVHLRIGTLHAMLGRPDEARRHFTWALTLDATLETPPELPPPLQALFNEAAEARVAFSLAVEVVEPGPPTQVRVTASESLSGVAETLSVSVGGGTAEVSSADAPVELTLPQGRFATQDTLEVEARALDAHGGVLARTRTEVPRPVPAVAVTFPGARPDSVPPVTLQPTEAQEDDGGLLSSPWFWLTTTLVVLTGVGIAVGLAVELGQDVYDFGAPTVTR